MYIQDKPTPLDENNYIIADFPEKPESCQIIAAIDNYAELFTKPFYNEDYNLNISYIYNA